MPFQLMILVIYLLDYLYLISFFVPLYCFYTRLRGFAIIIIIIRAGLSVHLQLENIIASKSGRSSRSECCSGGRCCTSRSRFLNLASHVIQSRSYPDNF